MEALLQQYGDGDDDDEHDDDRQRQCLVELSRVPASASANASDHPLITPELSSLFGSTANRKEDSQQDMAWLPRLSSFVSFDYVTFPHKPRVYDDVTSWDPETGGVHLRMNFWVVTSVLFPWVTKQWPKIPRYSLSGLTFLLFRMDDGRIDADH
ncbi:hypothetical protein GW17_00036729 [Ensete ventricosum]|nr:hypothetical protein GW17_00036729 [Ensete ventricosum]